MGMPGFLTAGDWRLATGEGQLDMTAPSQLEKRARTKNWPDLLLSSLLRGRDLLLVAGVGRLLRRFRRLLLALLVLEDGVTVTVTVSVSAATRRGKQKGIRSKRNRENLPDLALLHGLYPSSAPTYASVRLLSPRRRRRFSAWNKNKDENEDKKRRRRIHRLETGR
ncbi:hypothetical protein DENSPDRAFT_838944 [Dentipellis sp. KUC8613]|nr:hypothetical protein DENSPDRAFT_838944 [Dentipellis sp. KUC8613]